MTAGAPATETVACVECGRTARVRVRWAIEATEHFERKGWGRRHGAWRCPDCWVALRGDRERYLATLPEGAAPGGEGREAGGVREPRFLICILHFLDVLPLS